MSAADRQARRTRRGQAAGYGRPRTPRKRAAAWIALDPRSQRKIGVSAAATTSASNDRCSTYTSTAVRSTPIARRSASTIALRVGPKTMASTWTVCERRYALSVENTIAIGTQARPKNVLAPSAQAAKALGRQRSATVAII